MPAGANAPLHNRLISDHPTGSELHQNFLVCRISFSVISAKRQVAR